MGFDPRPSVWGQGVGRALIAAGTEHLAAAGFEEATLWTEHRNQRPRRFYGAAGWRSMVLSDTAPIEEPNFGELRYRLILRDARQQR